MTLSIYKHLNYHVMHRNTYMTFIFVFLSEFILRQYFIMTFVFGINEVFIIKIYRVSQKYSNKLLGQIEHIISIENCIGNIKGNGSRVTKGKRKIEICPIMLKPHFVAQDEEVLIIHVPKRMK